MSNPATPQQGQHPVTYDQPLPGFYPCLTLQLNVTRYASEKVARMVLVVREPSDNVECFRTFIDTAPATSVLAETVQRLADGLRRMEYLQDGTNTH